ncbi:MAG TPA: hypothetical protein HPQ04_07190 [Rhodospirillaceae bacterium]|nr:hypothetical protein [Rhodospirillaceae bacterium]
MSNSGFPEAVFLRRADGTGYGFFYRSDADYRHAVDSFVRPILRSFSGAPVPGQPAPQAHLKTAIATFLGQAFDKAVPAEVGAEGVSRAVAACVADVFDSRAPRVVVIERKDGPLAVRPGIEFMRHPGFPLAIVVDADAHGGEAHFFTSDTDYRRAAQAPPGPRCWLPQIVFRLYARTPSVMAGRPLADGTEGRHSVEFRGISFGLPAPLEERAGV